MLGLDDKVITKQPGEYDNRLKTSVSRDELKIPS